MATSYPASIDTYTNPASTDFEDTIPHATQHQNHNDSVTAVETKLGTGASTATSNKVLRATGTGTSAWQQVNLTTDVSNNLPIQSGGTAASTLPTGLLVGAGVGAITAKTAPTGTVLGTTDAQVVTNKDLTSGTNTFPTTLATLTGTQTLTNKRTTKRTGTTASSATPTINTDNVDFYSITALAVAITSFTTNLSGTPTEGQTLWLAITDNGSARALTFGASFEASGNVALPTTTVISTRLDIGFVYNTVTTKWRCVAVA